MTMQVRYKTIVHRDSHGQEYETYELLQHEGKHCCERMARAWNGKAVVFGHADYGPNESRVQIAYRYLSYDSVDTETFAIDFCPFCGQKIDCQEAQRVRRVEERETYTMTHTRSIYKDEPI